MGSDKIRLTGSWTNLVGKVFLSIVTFDQLGGPDWNKNFSVTRFPGAVTGRSNTFDQLGDPDSRLVDWSGRFRQVISQRPMTYKNFSVTNFLGQ